jgi:hypothetical protein
MSCLCLDICIGSVIRCKDVVDSTIVRHFVRDFFSFIINVMNNEYGKITQLWYLRMENKYVDFDHRRGIGFDLGHPRAGEFDLGCQLASGFDPSHP